MDEHRQPADQLDRFIDALQAGEVVDIALKPDSDLADLYAVVIELRQQRRSEEIEWPDAGFPNRLTRELAAALTPSPKPASPDRAAEHPHPSSANGHVPLQENLASVLIQPTRHHWLYEGLGMAAASLVLVLFTAMLVAVLRGQSHRAVPASTLAQPGATSPGLPSLPTPLPAGASNAPAAVPGTPPSKATPTPPSPTTPLPRNQEPIVWQAVVRGLVDTIDPLLQPRTLPDDLDTVSLKSVAPGSFQVIYSGTGKQLLIGVFGWNPPLCGADCSQQQVAIRGQRATLQVQDQGLPGERVWLWWSEPGRWGNSGLNQPAGPAYLISTEGLTPEEVLQVAGSLTPFDGPSWAAQKEAWLAAGRATEIAEARLHPPPSPRPVPPLPSSCPREVPAQPGIAEARVNMPITGGNVAASVQATVVVGQDVYRLGAGVERDNRQQGVIVVWHPVPDPCAHPEQRDEIVPYPTPEQHGAVALTAVSGEVVTFQTTDGTTGRFDVVTRQYL